MDLTRKIAPKLVLFDLDGTLVDTAPDLSLALNHVLEASGRAALPTQLVKQYVGKGARRLIERGLEEFSQEVSEAEIQALHRDFLTYYEANIAVSSRPYAGVTKLLEKLTEKRIPAAVITKKSEALANRLFEELGLTHHFFAVLGGDSEFGAKPDPDPLLHMCKEVDVLVGEALMVGDSEVDYEAARRAEMPIALINSGYSEDDLLILKPNYQLDKFEDLLDLI